MTRRSPSRPAARPLAEVVCGLMTPICRKRGVANANLMLDPEELFGARFARSASVVRIMWPRGSRIDEASSTGATLIVSAEPAAALTLQHVAPQIVERANLIIGWHAIARVKIVQSAPRPKTPEPPPKPEPQPEDIARVDAMVGGVADQKLKDALSQLGVRVAARGLRGRADRP